MAGMKFNEPTEYKKFNKGQVVTCVANERASKTRGPVKLTNGKIYTVAKCESVHVNSNKVIVFVENDEGIIERYSSKRFEFDREAILSTLLD